MTKELIEAIGSGAEALKQLGEIGAMLLKPMATRAQGAAEADALLTVGHAKITLAELQIAARRHAELDEVRHYTNLVEALHTAKAVIEDKTARGLLSEKAAQGESDPDWKYKWANGAKETSDPDIRALWAKVLAGEIIQPGKFSLRLLHTISLLRKSEAQDFSRLANYVCMDEEGRMFVVDAHWDSKWLLNEFGFDGEFFKRLENIGLIQGRSGIGGTPKYLKETTVSYAGKSYSLKRLYMQEAAGSLLSLSIESRELTDLGRELYEVCAVEPDGKYAELLFTEILGSKTSGWTVIPH